MADVDWPCCPTVPVPVAHPGLRVAERYQLCAQVGVAAMGPSGWQPTSG